MPRINDCYEDLMAGRRDTPEYQTERILVDFLEDLVLHMEQHGPTRAELARRLNVSRAFVTHLFKGNPNLTIKTLVRVAHAAGLVVNVTTERRRPIVAITPAETQPVRESPEKNQNQYALAA